MHISRRYERRNRISRELNQTLLSRDKQLGELLRHRVITGEIAALMPSGLWVKKYNTVDFICFRLLDAFGFNFLRVANIKCSIFFNASCSTRCLSNNVSPWTKFPLQHLDTVTSLSKARQLSLNYPNYSRRFRHNSVQFTKISSSRSIYEAAMSRSWMGQVLDFSVKEMKLTQVKWFAVREPLYQLFTSPS